MQQVGRRIVVGGPSGSGKTYLARELASRLDVPYICNDAIIWGPQWTPTPREERHPRFEEATRGEGWTFDGNIASLKDPEDRLILGRADTLIWLDLPLLRVQSQLLVRTVIRSATRRELWHGNRENWRSSFASRDTILLWSLKTHRLRKRQHGAIFADPEWAGLRRIRLTSRRQVERLLRQCPPNEAATREATGPLGPRF